MASKTELSVRLDFRASSIPIHLQYGARSPYGHTVVADHIDAAGKVLNGDAELILR